MSAWDKPLAYVLNPAGGGQDYNALNALKQAGYQGIILDCHDFDPRSGAWDQVEHDAHALGLVVYPWCRVYVVKQNHNLPTNVAAIDWSYDLFVERYGKVGMIDLEGDELHAADAHVVIEHAGTEAVRRGIDLATSTEPRMADVLANTLLVDYGIVELQMYPQSNATSQDPRWCRATAYQLGAGRVRFLIGVKDAGKFANPSQFPPMQAPFTMYCADQVPFQPSDRYKAWAPVTLAPLTIPYTGPLYGPSQRKIPSKSPTCRALKMALHEAGMAFFPTPDPYYNGALETAMRHLQRWSGLLPSGQYGKGSYEALRRLASAIPGHSYALTEAAQKFIRS